jgi:hypothetical protein
MCSPGPLPSQALDREPWLLQQQAALYRFLPTLQFGYLRHNGLAQ